MELILSLT